MKRSILGGMRKPKTPVRNKPGECLNETEKEPTPALILTAAEKNEHISKLAKKEAELPLLVVTDSLISFYSWEQMQNLGGDIIVKKTKKEGINSVNDDRMGVIDLDTTCQKCGQIDCPGHYGLIKFPRDIFNPAAIRELALVLTCVCNSCGGLLMTEDMIKQHGLHKLSYEKRLPKMAEICIGTPCYREKPAIRGGKIEPCKANPHYLPAEVKDAGKMVYQEKPGKHETRHNKDIESVEMILDKVSEHDALLMGFPKGSHPKNIIMKGLPVIPLIARPPAPDPEGGDMRQDMLSNAYNIMVHKIENMANKTTDTQELYSQVKQLFFNNEGKKMGMRDFMSIVERIQGKHALLRNLLMGKRNNHCGRTVSGPDASLRFGEIGVPMEWAKILTKKIRVTNFNIAELTKLLHEGKVTHIISNKTALRKDVRQVDTQNLRLHIGDYVERFLQNGDRVIVNRQPTLHKQSMMAYNIVLGKPLTVRLHLSYTSPMNNDFDGDENNLWNPQDFEVEAEAETIMNVKNNIMSAEQNRPIMGLVMNSVSGCYLISQPSVRIDDDLFAQLLEFVSDKESLKTLFYRLNKYGVHPRSGQAIFSATLPADFYYNIKGVRIMEGILVSGILTKAHVGASHRSIIQELHKSYSHQRVADFFTEVPWIINKWLVERGFSVGLADCLNLVVNEKGEEIDKNKEILKKELANVYVKIEALGLPVDDPIEEMFRKRQINDIVNVSKGIGMKLADDVLSKDNSIGVMTEKGAGTKGDVANIGQMMGAVGQQFYKGNRLAPTITGGRRLLPTFDVDDTNPEAHAFIPQSFETGLTPEGLFFLQAGGRENLLDTALKTAETGSLQHKLTKALESIIIGYDGSIRNTTGTMFCPMYNSGYNIAEMVQVEKNGKPDFSSFMDLKAKIEELNMKRGWVPKDVRDKIIEMKQVNTVDPNLETILAKDEAVIEIINDPVDLKANVEKILPETKITAFERTRIISTRAMQLSNNAAPMIDTHGVIDPVSIAEAEYESGLCQQYIIRKFPDGTYLKVYPTLENI